MSAKNAILIFRRKNQYTMCAVIHAWVVTANLLPAPPKGANHRNTEQAAFQAAGRPRHVIGHSKALYYKGLRRRRPIVNRRGLFRICGAADGTQRRRVWRPSREEAKCLQTQHLRPAPLPGDARFVGGARLW